MKKGVKFMKILKNEDNVSYLYVDGKYKKILEISKEDILKSLEYIYENEEIELEEYDKEKKKKFRKPCYY